MSKRAVAIDPGKNGGVAYHDANGTACCVPMPATEGDVLDLFRTLRASGIEAAVVEQVCGFIPAAGAGAMFTFGEGFGFVKGALMALGFRVELVRPKKWQLALSTGAKKDHPGSAWKQHLKAMAQRLFPNTEDVSLKTADALLLLEWWSKTNRKET